MIALKVKITCNQCGNKAITEKTITPPDMGDTLWQLVDVTLGGMVWGDQRPNVLFCSDKCLKGWCKENNEKYPEGVQMA